MSSQRFAPPTEVPGLAARRIAADIVDGVLHKRRTLDDQLDGTGAHPGLKTLPDRDRALMRRLVATILRKLGTLGHVLSRLLDRGMPTDAPRAQSALLIGAAQILWMDVPDHAAVDLSVRLVQSDRRAARYAGLVNAVLRRCAREGEGLIAEVKAELLDLPPWLSKRWIAHYGEATAHEMAAAIGFEPSLDLTVKAEPNQWASRLHGMILPTGSVRTLLQGSVTMLPGFAEGQWWVQDAAAALPAKLLGDVAGQTILDLCAAPGGKTAQLAAAGAEVTALDRSRKRLERVKENLARLHLAAHVETADAALWRKAKDFDAILLDAPCSATGTIRRHPDVPHLKRPADLPPLVAAQRRLLAAAAAMLRPGGRLVYAVCSLQAEEAEAQVAAAAALGLRPEPFTAAELAALPEARSAEGWLRTHPGLWAGRGGMDGFFAARLRRA
jgi:16S rRNA (cytosine967-C5)-methyltransferase